MVQVADPWKLAEDMMFSGAVIEGTITGCNKRGIYVQLPDLKGECYLPVCTAQTTAQTH